MVYQHRVLTSRDYGKLRESPGEVNAKAENLTDSKVRGFITGGVSPGCTEQKHKNKSLRRQLVKQ